MNLLHRVIILNLLKKGKKIPIVGKFFSVIEEWINVFKNTAKEIKCEMVLLAMGFVGPEKSPLISDFGLELDNRGNIKRADNFETNVENVFVAGDAGAD